METNNNNFVIKPLASDSSCDNEALEKFQKTILNEIRSLKAGFEEKLTALQQQVRRLEENKNNQKDEDFASIRSDIAELNKKIENSLKIELPIREAIVGKWEMVSCENFREYNMKKGYSFERFSENLKFKLEDGRLILIKGKHIFKEGVVSSLGEDLFVENNRLKTVRKSGTIVERYIEDGKLHTVQHEGTIFYKRVYKRV